MKESKLHEELFKFLADSGDTGGKIQKLAQQNVENMKMAPPQAVWSNIQKGISESANQRSGRSFGEALKNVFNPPLVPALAIGVAGILVGAFLLLNRGTSSEHVPLTELSALTEQKAGAVFVARGMRIENTGKGSISHESGPKEKITIASGAWKMQMNHSELERPVEFVFPGGMLEPIGTAFTLTISGDATTVDLTEGKIRLTSGPAAAQRTQIISAPYQGRLGAEPVSKTPQAPLSKYANLVGRNVTVALKNGDRLSGRVKSTVGGKILLANSSGLLTVREGDIESITRN